jgi:hypothetical protein
VGFEADSDYLGFFGRRVYGRVTAVPHAAAAGTDPAAFRRRTAVSLLAARDLAMISVWSPTFLTLLLEEAERHRESVLAALAASGVRGTRRAAEVAAALDARGPGPRWVRVWPRLALISCWAHGPSRLYAERLGALFDGVTVQPKGLIATEAFVSLPLAPGRDPVLAAGSHFFEFEEPGSGHLRLAHELARGSTYAVIVSTGGGLYRYRLGDLVEVTGFLAQAPTLRFIAREAGVCDLFGEKLHPAHVQRCAEQVFAAHAVAPGFFLLAPVRAPGGRAAYCLFLSAGPLDPGRLERVRRAAEARLRENFHYAHCRDIGQLDRLRLFLIDPDAEHPEHVYLREMQRRNIRLGDVKPAALDRETGWETRFAGRFLA